MVESGKSSNYGQIHDSIKSIYELTARVDERQQIMMNKVDQLERKIDRQTEDLSNIESRLRVVESNSDYEAVDTLREKIQTHEIRLNALEISKHNNENRWEMSLRIVVELVFTVLLAYVLFKLGLQAPPT